MSRLTIGAVLLGLISAAALLSLVWTPATAPLALDIANRLSAPGPGHVFGTDQLGRDTASLVMLGAANALVIAVPAMLIAMLIGSAAGIWSGVRGGSGAALAMRALEILFAFPPVLSAMLLALTLGPGRTSAILAIGLFAAPVFARVSAAEARRIMASEHVLAARALGAGPGRILRAHVLPALGGLIAVQASIQFGLAILTEAGLGYLGLGTPPPSPSWGRMLADSQTYLQSAPWLALTPGMAIAICVLGAGLLGDGLAARLDPRRARTRTRTRRG
ncbi:ABC transporter permease [Aureimonas frigidaquae]|uniref:ABC transporter permease n=1 Tax=Aureimonas frigidaquae TaxID=424757 RepID=UPI000781686D|nr:ABC transporter permease [Aureimonas frigidaquae]